MAATIRRLQDSDSRDIIEISRHVWEGHDYIPSVADQWLHDPDCHFYGVEIDGHVVALGNLRLIEDGRTGWMEGLRVHSEFRGKGFAKEITWYLVRKAQDLGLRRLRYTTSSRNVASVKLAKMAGFLKVFEMAVSWHHKPKLVPAISEYLPIQKQSLKRTCSLMRANSGIVPHGILIYDWKVLDNTCENLEEIGKTHEFYIALKEKRMDSLSFSHAGEGLNQSWWNFTTYATDLHGFLSQFSCNVAMALKRGSTSIACTFETRFEKALRDVNLKSEEDDEGRLVLFEKQMRQ